MPDRSPVLRRTLYLFMSVITVLSAACLIAILVAVSYASSADKAVSSLKKSSARSECRTQLTNADQAQFEKEVHDFQGNISAFLNASVTRDLDKISDINSRMSDLASKADGRQTAQDAIDDQCPPPLVETPTYTIPATPTTTGAQPPEGPRGP